MKIRKIHRISSTKITAYGKQAKSQERTGNMVQLCFMIINDLFGDHECQVKTSKRCKTQEEPTVVDFPVSEYQPTNYLLLPE